MVAGVGKKNERKVQCIFTFNILVGELLEQMF